MEKKINTIIDLALFYHNNKKIPDISDQEFSRIIDRSYQEELIEVRNSNSKLINVIIDKFFQNNPVSVIKLICGFKQTNQKLSDEQISHVCDYFYNRMNDILIYQFKQIKTPYSSLYNDIYRYCFTLIDSNLMNAKDMMMYVRLLDPGLVTILTIDYKIDTKLKMEIFKLINLEKPHLIGLKSSMDPKIFEQRYLLSTSLNIPLRQTLKEVDTMMINNIDFN